MTSCVISLLCPSDQTDTASKTPSKVIESTTPTNTNRPTSPHVVLTDSDLSVLFGELIELASEWENIGVLLGINTGTLNSIKSDEKSAVSCLRKMLETWLKQVNSQPTLNALCKAVEKFDPRYAQQLKQKYLS